MKRSTEAAFVTLDAHSHILPKMDDGSHSVDESCQLLRRLVKQGVEAVCMTPHFYPWKEAPDAFLKRRETSIRALLSQIRDMDNMPEIYFGAEVAFFQGMGDAQEMDELCIGQSRILLVEMPFTKWTKRMVDELYTLKEYRNITPMIAHVDRYLDYGNEETVEEMAQRGILIQANQSFFLKRFGLRKPMSMMKRGMIHFIGSDCHNLHSRKPELDEAAARIYKKCGEEVFGYLANMQRLIRARGDAD